MIIALYYQGFLEIHCETNNFMGFFTINIYITITIYRQTISASLKARCSRNNLELTTKKRKDIIEDFRKEEIITWLSSKVALS